MRIMLTTLMLFSVVGFAAFAQQNERAARGTQVCSLKVTGMFCGACAKTVEKTAKKVDGVKAAKVSQSNGAAEITYDPNKTTPEAIAKVIASKTPFKAEVVQKP